MFVAIWRRRGDLDLKTVSPAYLRQAARRRAGDLVAKRRRRLALLDENSPIWSKPSEDASLMALTREFEEALQHALTVLPLAERETFGLIADGYSYAEAARVRGVAAKTIENQVARARKKLRGILAPFFWTGATPKASIAHSGADYGLGHGGSPELTRIRS